MTSEPGSAACKFGDPTCPCQDGDVCHYVDDPKSETLAMTPPGSAAPPFSIGATLWPGLTKAAEESGELVQVIAKLMATGGAADHWDGTNLHDRLTEELADVLAAVYFVAETNADSIDLTAFYARVDDKLALFRRWHDDQQGGSDAA